MSIEWNDTFILGIDEIDKQHQSIVEHFTNFSQAVQDGCARELLSDMADFLVNYAQEHFETEERYMLQYHYPRIDEQRHEHEQFTKDACELQKQIHEDGVSREMAVALTGKMVRWVIQHVRNHDKEMVGFIKEQMKKA